jgi:beta-glucanase (GH16 family)
MKGGKLRMYALHNKNVLPKDTATYLTAGITSEKKATFTYGKVVVRARVHGAIGSWPAVWIMPEDRKLWDQKLLKYSEIDLLEYVNQNDFVYQTAHNAYTLAAKENRHNPEQQNLSKIEKDSYNIYSVEILPNVLIFAVNDKEMFRYPCVSENKKFFNYGVESHIIINTQVDPPKGLNKGMQTNSFPAYIDIDWIKVYKLKQ